MNLEELKAKIEAEIQRIAEAPECTYLVGKSVGLVTVLQWLDEPWEPDVALLEKVLEKLAHIERCEMRAANVFEDESRRCHQARFASYMRVLTFLNQPAALHAEAKRLGLEEGKHE